MFGLCVGLVVDDRKRFLNFLAKLVMKALIYSICRLYDVTSASWLASDDYYVDRSGGTQ